MSTETLGFQTEVKQLLHLMIHSLYSHREVFLRELISNASDALDKLRFLALDNSALYEGDSELRIRLRYDDDAHTIILEDNGIGMTREEVIENLGTIARSGTKEFLSRITGDKSRDTQLIDRRSSEGLSLNWSVRCWILFSFHCFGGSHRRNP